MTEKRGWGHSLVAEYSQSTSSTAKENRKGKEKKKLRVHSQAGLQNKFQDSQNCYTEKPCLKKQNNKQQQQKETGMKPGQVDQ